MEGRQLEVENLPKEIAVQFYAPLESLKNELPPLQYKVVHPKPITLRPEPSVYAPEVGRVEPGEGLRGYPERSWLQVQEREGAGPLPPNAWALVDGSALGAGCLVMPEWASVSVSHVYKGAVTLTWPGLPLPDVVYYISVFYPRERTRTTFTDRRSRRLHPEEQRRIGGKTFLVMPGGQEPSLLVRHVPSGATVALVAKLASGLLVAPLRQIRIPVDEDVAPAPQLVAEPALADRMEEEHARYKLKVKEMKQAIGEPLPPDFVAAILAEYAKRPREAEDAKRLVMSSLFGKELGVESAAQEDAAQDVGIFTVATELYEEGGAGELNRKLADVVGALSRKHG